MRKKRFLALLAAIALVCGLVGCLADTDTGQVVTEQVVQESQQRDIIAKSAIIYDDCYNDRKKTVYIAGINYDADIEFLDISNSNLDTRDISSLSQFSNLKHLDLSGNAIDDISVLKECTTLETLDLGQNPIKDISPLSCLKNLETLYLNSLKVDDYIDLSPLSGIKNLKKLDIHEGRFNDIQVIGDLVNLEELYLSNIGEKGVTELNTSFLYKMDNLKILDMSYCFYYNSVDLNGLKNCINLEWLFLDNSSIDDLNGLDTLNNLKRLTLDKTSVSDLSSISTLKSLEVLSINYCICINDLSPICGLNNLKELYARSCAADVSPIGEIQSLEYLDIKMSSVTDSSFLSNLSNLKYIDISCCGISDVSFMTGLRELEEIIMEENMVKDISAFAYLPKIKTIKMGRSYFVNSISVISQIDSLENFDIYIPFENDNSDAIFEEKDQLEANADINKIKIIIGDDTL